VSKSLFVKISTFDSSDDEVREPFIVDYSKHSDRERVQKHTSWAMHQGHEIVVAPVEV